MKALLHHDGYFLKCPMHKLIRIAPSPLPRLSHLLAFGRDSFGSVESVKAASDVYAPANGEVVEINEVRFLMDYFVVWVFACRTQSSFKFYKGFNIRSGQSLLIECLYIRGILQYEVDEVTCKSSFEVMHARRFL